MSPLRRLAVATGGLALGALVFAATRGEAPDTAMTAVVQRGALTVELSATGTLRPVASLTYRSPLPGRELEIVAMVAEGTRVEVGDLLVRFDATELQEDLDRLQQELRQLRLDLQVAHAQRQEAEAALQMTIEGDGALTVEEARLRAQAAERKTARLRAELDELRPLLERGFITRDELARTVTELEQAEDDLAFARRRSEIAVRLTQPREKQRASLQLAQRHAEIENLSGRVEAAEQRLRQLHDIVAACDVHAERAGLVVHEMYLNASPRRKVRVGDRVTASQAVLTIPEVSRMVVEASVGESEMHRLRPGQPAVIHVEAFPELRLTGSVVRIGTLAAIAQDRPLDGRRFDVVVEVDPNTADLRPEMTARADVLVGRLDDAVLVPVTAIVADGPMLRAHVASPLRLESRTVEVGLSNGRLVEVKSGLQVGERVMLVDPLAPEPPSSSASSPYAAATQ